MLLCVLATMFAGVAGVLAIADARRGGLNEQGATVRGLLCIALVGGAAMLALGSALQVLAAERQWYAFDAILLTRDGVGGQITIPVLVLLASAAVVLTNTARLRHRSGSRCAGLRRSQAEPCWHWS